VLRRTAVEDAPRELAREGLLELGFAPPEAERLLTDVAGETAEEVLAAALRATRRGGDPR
jgi:Holliday junction resolvasome RuvABC DNA-binding subunit